jgi:membrane associated rhomboid family serine protease
MITVRCSCGRDVECPNDTAKKPVVCPHCERVLRIAGPGTGGDDMPTPAARFTIAEGPDRVGEQLILVGNEPIGIGSDAENSIALPAGDVPIHAARLTPTSDSWRLDDLTGAGLFVNHEVTTARELRTGDVLQVGPYELEYTGAALPAMVAAAAAPQQKRRAVGLSESFSTPRPSERARVNCPSCSRALPLGAKICVDCGIDLQTGRRLLTSQEVDENTLYARADTAVRVISWILPFGLYPIASEGLGSRKPYVVWAIALGTVIVSLWFWSHNLAVPAEERSDRTLVLWVGHAAGAMPAPASPNAPQPAAFHAWQLFTYAWVHAGLLMLIVNVAFLLVLGSRVNALIGNVRAAIVYPLLGVVMGLVYLRLGLHRPPQPVSGAAGPVMGLAGIYLVLLPVHRVHLAAWVRTGPSPGFRLAHNVFAVGGAWVVLIYAAVDALSTLLEDPFHATAWAHFAGLPIGIALGLALLLGRQADAHGADVISVLLGRRAWALLGRPGQRAAG